jgi:hypothetical protein
MRVDRQWQITQSQITIGLPSPQRSDTLAAGTEGSSDIIIKESEAMTGIQFVTDEKGRKVAVQIDLRKHRALWEEVWDGLVSESRRSEKSIPYEQYRSGRLKRRAYG